VFVITAKETIMDIYEIAHALRDIQDAHRALDKDIEALRSRIAGSKRLSDSQSRLDEHMAKWGRRPLITLAGE
jgi:hypothetical protein